MAGVPNVFGAASAPIPLSQLDANFNTTATLGNAAIGLGNVTTTVGNLTLSNVTIPSISGVGANCIVYTSSTSAVTGNSSVVCVSGTNVGIGTTSPSYALSVARTTAGGVSILDLDNASAVNYGGLRVSLGKVDREARLEATYGSSFFTFYTDGSERMRIDSSGNVGIGGAPSTATRTTVQNVGSPVGYWVSSGVMQIQSNAVYNSGDKFIGSGYALYYAQDPSGGNHSWATSTASGTAGNNITYTERARITSDGVFAVGKTSTDSSTVGASMRTDGYCTMVRSADKCLDVNRKTNDGTLVSFQQDNTEEGSISVSGNTVSYNAFAGSHWSQLQQGRGYNPDIHRGTVMSSIGEMCEWKSVVWDEVIEHPAVPAVEAKDAVLDEEGNVIEPAVEAVEGKDAWTETIPHREAYLGNLAVGATFTEDGVTKTVVDDGNERLPKVKISDAVGDKAVYGVFQTWDEVQDMLVTSLGAFVVRIAAGVTVQIGDLLESNGDGCAKVQDDDVIRSKTIGKVTSTTPTATYADGSYTVPAVLYCG